MNELRETKSLRQAWWLSIALAVLGALGVLLSLYAGVAHAQETVPTLSPEADALVKQVVTALLNGNPWLAAATLLWIAIAAAKGKLGFRVPLLSDWWDARTWWQRALTVAGLGIAVGIITPLAGGAALTVGGVVTGITTGLGVAAAAMGLNGAAKAKRDAAAKGG